MRSFLAWTALLLLLAWGGYRTYPLVFPERAPEEPQQAAVPAEPKVVRLPSGWSKPAASRGEEDRPRLSRRQLAQLRKAGERGVLRAQVRLAALHYSGIGVARQSYEEAATWFRKAAEQGHLESQISLSVMLYRGLGVAQNFEQAALWTRKAADQGDAHAQYFLGHLYYLGEGLEANKEQAAAWTRRAAEQGHAGAQFRLGQMYFTGEGVASDEVRAWLWFDLAAAQGNEKALDIRAQLQDVLTAEQIAQARQLGRQMQARIDSNSATDN